MAAVGMVDVEEIVEIQEVEVPVVGEDIHHGLHHVEKKGVVGLILGHQVDHVVLKENLFHQKDQQVVQNLDLQSTMNALNLDQDLDLITAIVQDQDQYQLIVIAPDLTPMRKIKS